MLQIRWVTEVSLLSPCHAELGVRGRMSFSRLVVASEHFLPDLPRVVQAVNL